jgi:uncharacterized coiled-coil DUF342 family protein
MFDFLSIKNTVTSLTNNIAEVRKSAEKLRQERDLVLATSLEKADVIKFLHLRLDQIASDYPNKLRKSIDNYLNAPAAQKLSGNNHSMNFLISNAAGINAGTLLDGFSFLFNQQLKDGISRAIEQMDWPENTMSLSAQKVASVFDAQINKLEKEESELLKHASDAGVTINF